MFTVIKMLHGCFVDYYPCKIHNNFQKGEVTYVNIKDRSNKEVVGFISYQDHSDNITDLIYLLV